MHRWFSVWSYRNVSVTCEPTAVLKLPTAEGRGQHNEWKTSGKITQWNWRPKTMTAVQNSHLPMKYKTHSPGQVVAQSSNKRCTDRRMTVWGLTASKIYKWFSQNTFSVANNSTMFNPAQKRRWIFTRKYYSVIKSDGRWIILSISAFSQSWHHGTANLICGQ